MAAAEHPLRELSAWTWIDSTPDGLVSMVLITPAADGPPGLGALAERVGLRQPSEPLPSPGLRLVLHDGYAMVILPQAETALRIPADTGWADFVRRSGTVIVILGEQALAAGATRADVDRYLLDAVMPGRIWLGKTRLAADYASAQVRGETCIICGRAGRDLTPVGYAYTPTTGAPLGWPVAAHPGPCPTAPEEKS
ncbi:hypothetical protein [Kitasatospora sp. NPDC056184]|uniref:hypothetical protein n=1 Tax=Kitasatospora sp. NPDC056184 TaxID=3345738 RepID=UPI0035DDCBF5